MIPTIHAWPCLSERGASQFAGDYVELSNARARLVTALEARFSPYDVVLMPTVGIVPPQIIDLTADDAFSRINLYVLRNASFVNMLDG